MPERVRMIETQELMRAFVLQVDAERARLQNDAQSFTGDSTGAASAAAHQAEEVEAEPKCFSSGHASVCARSLMRQFFALLGLPKRNKGWISK